MKIKKKNKPEQLFTITLSNEEINKLLKAFNKVHREQPDFFFYDYPAIDAFTNLLASTVED